MPLSYDHGPEDKPPEGLMNREELSKDTYEEALEARTALYKAKNQAVVRLQRLYKWQTFKMLISILLVFVGVTVSLFSLSNPSQVYKSENGRWAVPLTLTTISGLGIFIWYSSYRTSTERSFWAKRIQESESILDELDQCLFR